MTRLSRRPRVFEEEVKATDVVVRDFKKIVSLISLVKSREKTMLVMSMRLVVGVTKYLLRDLKRRDWPADHLTPEEELVLDSSRDTVQVTCE